MVFTISFLENDITNIFQKTKSIFRRDSSAKQPKIFKPDHKFKPYCDYKIEMSACVAVKS